MLKINIKQSVLKICLWLFILTASAGVPSSSTIGIYNMFGVMETVAIQTTAEVSSANYMEQKPAVNYSHEKGNHNRAISELNFEWLLQAIVIFMVWYIIYSDTIPQYRHPITLKVRLND